MSAEGACWMTELRCTGKVLKIDGTGRRRWVRSPAARGIQIRRCAVSAAAALGARCEKQRRPRHDPACADSALFPIDVERRTTHADRAGTAA